MKNVMLCKKCNKLIHLSKTQIQTYRILITVPYLWDVPIRTSSKNSQRYIRDISHGKIYHRTLTSSLGTNVDMKGYNYNDINMVWIVASYFQPINQKYLWKSSALQNISFLMRTQNKNSNLSTPFGILVYQSTNCQIELFGRIKLCKWI